MALKFQPRVGNIVRCDFRGMIEPEMVKVREVVVVAKHRHNPGLVTIVPLSTTEPQRIESYHHRMKSNQRPGGDPDEPVWAKCDMLYTVSLERLDMYYKKSRRGGRDALRLEAAPDDLKAIKGCIAAALQLPDNGPVPFGGIESGSASASIQPGS